MKPIFISLLFLSLVTVFSSCEEDEGRLPNISFKTGDSYISTDVTKPAGSDILIGISASKAEDKDVLKKFNISCSVNNAVDTTVYEKEMSGSEADNYSYDFSTKADTVSGQTNKYTFTVTNRDGLVNQVMLTVTVE